MFLGTHFALLHPAAPSFARLQLLIVFHAACGLLLSLDKKLTPVLPFHCWSRRPAEGSTPPPGRTQVLFPLKSSTCGPARVSLSFPFPFFSFSLQSSPFSSSAGREHPIPDSFTSTHLSPPPPPNPHPSILILFYFKRLSHSSWNSLRKPRPACLTKSKTPFPFLLFRQNPI